MGTRWFSRRGRCHGGNSLKGYRRPPYQRRRILVAVLHLRLCKPEGAFWARGHPVISEPDLGRTYRSFRQQVTPRLGGLPGRRPRHETLFSVCLPFAAHVLAGDGRGPRGRYMEVHIGVEFRQPSPGLFSLLPGTWSWGWTGREKGTQATGAGARRMWREAGDGHRRSRVAGGHRRQSRPPVLVATCVAAQSRGSSSNTPALDTHKGGAMRSFSVADLRPVLVARFNTLFPKQIR
jgi:hypothetical protein